MLLVGEHGSGKTRLLRQAATAHGVPVVDLGAELPPSLFQVPSRKRPVTVADTLGDMLRAASDPAVIDNIEVLFEPELRIDPLKLLQDHARNRVVVAAWPGTWDGDVLTFASPDHPEHRTFSQPDAALLVLSQT